WRIVADAKCGGKALAARRHEGFRHPVDSAVETAVLDDAAEAFDVLLEMVLRALREPQRVVGRQDQGGAGTQRPGALAQGGQRVGVAAEEHRAVETEGGGDRKSVV